MYPKEIQQIPERFFRQAYETVYDNLETIERERVIVISAFNHSINNTGYCPTITTRVEGFKTAVLLVGDV